MPPLHDHGMLDCDPAHARRPNGVSRTRPDGIGGYSTHTPNGVYRTRPDGIGGSITFVFSGLRGYVYARNYLAEREGFEPPVR
jgi:hypothetical protein